MLRGQSVRHLEFVAALEVEHPYFRAGALHAKLSLNAPEDARAHRRANRACGPVRVAPCHPAGRRNGRRLAEVARRSAAVGGARNGESRYFSEAVLTTSVATIGLSGSSIRCPG